MKTLKRISATINAQINAIVDQIEDHEAVANMALQDIRESLMQAKFQIRRVQNEQRIFEQRLKEMNFEERKWTERALQSEATSHDQALECMRRLKKAQDEIKSLTQQLTEHATLEEKLNDDVRKIELRFEELKRKKNLLAARESRASALAVLSESPVSSDVHNVFERWEQKVLKDEVASEPMLESEDALSAEFDRHEERQELEALLEELKKKNS